MSVSTGGMHVLERERFDELLGALARRGYTVIGPRVADGAIVYGELRSAAELPVGWTDEQDGGHYRLDRRDDEALFGYAVGPHSWKRFQLPPEVRLFRARLGEDGSLTELAEPPPDQTRYAFLGARSCELHAMGILDRVVRDGRRCDAFVVAVNCGQAGGTCFCVSMNTGPKARDGFDLALTEVLEDAGTGSPVEPGSDAGAELLAELAAGEAGPAEAARPSAPPSGRPRRWAARWTSRTSASCSTATSSTRAGTRSPTAV